MLNYFHFFVLFLYAPLRIINELSVISCFFFFERTRPAASMRPPLASFTSLQVAEHEYLSAGQREIHLV